MHADGAVHAVVADHHDDRQPILHRDGEFLAAHQEIAVAIDRQHQPLRMQPLHRDRRRHAVTHRRRSRRDVGHVFAEAVEAVDPRGIIAGAVAQDRVRRHVVAQPDHDLAEIDVAGLRRGCGGPGEKIGVGGLGAVAPCRFRRDRQALQRRDKAVRRGVDRQMRPVHPADFLGAGMDVHQFRLRRRTRKQRIALRRNFAEPPADQHQQIGGLGARHQFRIGAEPEIAGIERMQGIEQRRAAIAGGDRQSRASANSWIWRRAASDQRLPPSTNSGFFASASSSPSFVISSSPGEVSTGSNAGAVATRYALAQHVLRQRQHHRPGPAAACGVKRARDEFGDAVGIVDLGGPFGHAAEHRAVIQFLERLALPAPTFPPGRRT